MGNQTSYFVKEVHDPATYRESECHDQAVPVNYWRGIPIWHTHGTRWMADPGGRTYRGNRFCALYTAQGREGQACPRPPPLRSTGGIDRGGTYLHQAVDRSEIFRVGIPFCRRWGGGWLVYNLVWTTLENAPCALPRSHTAITPGGTGISERGTISSLMWPWPYLTSLSYFHAVQV